MQIATQADRKSPVSPRRSGLRKRLQCWQRPSQLLLQIDPDGSALCPGATAKFIIIDTQFLVFDTQFLVFDTQFL